MEYSKITDIALEQSVSEKSYSKKYFLDANRPF